jgi:hypothetical protein
MSFKILNEEEIQLLSEKDLEKYLQSLEEYKQSQTDLLSSIHTMDNALGELEKEENKLQNHNQNEEKIQAIRNELLDN